MTDEQKRLLATFHAAPDLKDALEALRLEIIDRHAALVQQIRRADSGYESNGVVPAVFVRFGRASHVSTYPGIIEREIAKGVFAYGMDFSPNVNPDDTQAWWFLFNNRFTALQYTSVTFFALQHISVPFRI